MPNEKVIHDVTIEPVEKQGFIVEVTYKWNSEGPNFDAEKYIVTNKGDLDALLVKLL